MESSDRQKRFLKAAYKVAREPEQKFFIEEVGRKLKFNAQESLDIANILASEGFAYLAYRRDYKRGPSGESIFVPNERGTGAIVTHLGREAARQLGDDERASRKARLWKGVASFWALAVTIAVPVCVTWLNGKIEQIKKDRQPSPVIQPATTQAAN